jgi:hypothetical protein
MNRFPIFRTVLAFAALPFTGCLSGTGSSTEHQATGLYRCIGESNYPPGELEEIMRDLRAQKPACPDHGSVVKGPELTAPAPMDAAETADSIRIHAVVLDERCNLVIEKEKMVPDRNRQVNSMDAWDMSRSDGTPAATGIYFINVASERADGSRDTGYVKVGMYQDPCGL